MPDPVHSNKPSVSGYYDAAGGQCVPEEPGMPRSEVTSAPPAAGHEPGTSREAVERLASGQQKPRALPSEAQPPRESCLTAGIQASLTCAGAVTGAILVSPTVVGLAAVFVGGAKCGVDAVQAYNCVSRPGG